MDGYNTCEINMTMTESKKNEIIETARKNGLDLEVQLFPKNNTTKEGFVIKTDSGANPVIYADSFPVEMSAAGIVSYMMDTLKNLDTEKVEISRILEMAKCGEIKPSSLKRRVACVNGNEKWLESMPHRKLSGTDLALYYAIKWVENMEIPVNTGIASLLNWTEEDMYLFTENEEYMYSDVGDILLGSGTYKPVANVANIGYKSLFVLTNTDKCHGASALSRTDVLRKLAEGFDGKNLIILPSSVHEVLIIPDYPGIEPETDDVEALAQMVSEVNLNEVATEEKLSDSVYRYVYSEDKVELIAGSVSVVDEEVASYE